MSQNCSWGCVFPGGGGFPFPSLVTKKAGIQNFHLQLYCVQFSPFRISRTGQGLCCLYVVLWSLDMYEQQPKTRWNRMNILCVCSVYNCICLHSVFFVHLPPCHVSGRATPASREHLTLCESPQKALQPHHQIWLLELARHWARLRQIHIKNFWKAHLCTRVFTCSYFYASCFRPENNSCLLSQATETTPL